MNVASAPKPPRAQLASCPLPAYPTPENEQSGESPRFTRDGSPELEQCLGTLCGEVLEAICELVPQRSIEALILAGGYGRGEGGVLKTHHRDRPYNDLEFYLFLRGNRLLNELRFDSKLHALGVRLSSVAGLDVEIKLDSISALRARPASMFSYDLISRHRTIYGSQDLFGGCERHTDAARLPQSEATRLLLNRGTGLLLAKSILERASSGRTSAPGMPSGHENPRGLLTPEESDFVERNLAKLQLGLGDACLAATGRYHWSCLERHSNLTDTSHSGQLPWFNQVLEAHAKGVEFKLHPHRSTKSVEVLRSDFEHIAALAREVWLWLESRRLAQRFLSIHDYAFSPCPKCDPSPAWRNRLLHLRLFGWKGLLSADSDVYPRERLFNSFPLLLWAGEHVTEPIIAQHLQTQLSTRASDWEGFLSSYRRIWSRYG